MYTKGICKYDFHYLKLQLVYQSCEANNGGKCDSLITLALVFRSTHIHHTMSHMHTNTHLISDPRMSQPLAWTPPLAAIFGMY